MIVCMAFIVTHAYAQPKFTQPDTSLPVYMEAKELGYDEENAVVVAQGNVEIVQGEYVLRADRIAYYQQQNIVQAEGNVSVLEPTGNVYFAERVRLKEDLKQGVIQQFRARLSDNSLFSAIEARKVSEQVTELDKAVYSPCEICEGEDPLWQIKADKVTINEAEQEVVYDDVYFEIYGVPVAYTPYLSHPTPDAERKSGFLRPEYEQNSNLGSVLRAPYYFNIAPDKDLTLTPIITTAEGPILEGEYRQLTRRGNYNMTGSITYPRERDDVTGAQLGEREVRGHIFARGQDKLADNVNVGFDIQRATDDTYLRRYKYGNQNSLTSRAYVEGIGDRSYAILQGITFQGLRVDDDPDTAPFIIPLAEAHYETDPMWRGSRFYASANTQVVTRDLGAKSQRGSVTGGWKLPVVTGGGQLIDVDASLRGDLYGVEDVIDSNGNSIVDETETRVVPTVAVKWRYPLIKRTENAAITVEPTVLAVATSNGNNPDMIPNEDNGIAEFSDGNLFDIHRFGGYDTVDDTSRVAYGVRSQVHWSEKTDLELVLGQNYSLSETPFAYNDDGGDGLSDIIGRFKLTYSPVELSYRFRLDQDDFENNLHEASAYYRTGRFLAGLEYLSLSNDGIIEDREEILLNMAAAITDKWRINGYGRRDLIADDMLNAGVGLTYQNECFTLLTSFNKTFTSDRDVEADTSFSVRFAFKNLNEI